MTKFVVPHDPNWKTSFEIEAQSIANSIGKGKISLHHIGSTAITGILAKPIIDLLGIVSNLDVLDARTNDMKALGYEVMGAYGIEGRRYFRKFDATGRRTHHLHVFADNSPHIERHLAFRDYLNSHSEVATQYSDLKALLTRETSSSWEDYMDGKDPFIAVVKKDAVKWCRRNQRG